jgi:hypothetical protein
MLRQLQRWHERQLRRLCERRMSGSRQYSIFCHVVPEEQLLLLFVGVPAAGSGQGKERRWCGCNTGVILGVVQYAVNPMPLHTDDGNPLLTNFGIQADIPHPVAQHVACTEHLPPVKFVAHKQGGIMAIGINHPQHLQLPSRKMKDGFRKQLPRCN